MKTFQSTAPFACLEAVQVGTGTGGECDLQLADAYGIGATLFMLLTGNTPVEVEEGEAAEAGGSLHAWEAALLERVRPASCSRHTLGYVNDARMCRLRRESLHRQARRFEFIANSTAEQHGTAVSRQQA